MKDMVSDDKTVELLEKAVDGIGKLVEKIKTLEQQTNELRETVQNQGQEIERLRKSVGEIIGDHK